MQTIDFTTTEIGPPADWPLYLRTALDICLSAPQPIIIFWGDDWRALYNSAFAALLGQYHPAALAKPARDVLGDAWQHLGPMLDDVRRTAAPLFRHEVELLPERFLDVGLNPIASETGAVAGVFAHLSDITVRVRAERRLRALNELGRLKIADTVAAACRSAIQAIGTNTVDIPAAGIYLVEPRRVRLVCSSENDQYFPAEVPLDSAIETAWPVAHSLSRKEPVHAEPDLLLVPAAESVLLALSLNPQLPFDDEHRTFCTTLADHVGRLVAQAGELERSRRHAEELRTLHRDRAGFFHHISQEFRTPLTLLLGPLEKALADEFLSDETRSQLQLAHRGSQRIHRLVNALLDLARIEAGRYLTHYEAVWLGEFTTGLASPFRSVIETAGLRLIVDCPELDQPVSVDRDMWEKIVLNLLSNALKFTFGGEIRITLRRDGDGVALKVLDTGVGIAPEELPGLFERFHRADARRARTSEGTGIGLALTRELVKLHGGEITVESVPNVGSTFRVRIPFAAPGQSPQPVASRPGAVATFIEEARQWLPESDTEPTLGDPLKPRVVLADDNADLRAYVKRLLHDYDVITASDGVRALELVRNRMPDIVLLDVTMPGLDGISVLERLRQDEITRRLPVILLSSRGDEERIRALQSGADDLLQKPFNSRELVACVAAHLQIAGVRDAADRHQKELRAKAEAANRMLELANEELRQFSYAASHDLQAPIRMIGTHTELLARRLRSTDEETAVSIRFILAGVDRMRSLVQDLLTYSVAFHADREPDVPVDLNFVFSQVVMLFDPLIRETGARITASPLPAVAAQWSSMTQIFQNLIGNSLKYRHPDRAPEINVTAEEVGDYWQITVADNGIGFDPKYAHHIFGLFKRLQGDAVPGSGLGLAICKRLIEKKGGRIWAEGESGVGARLIFTLPQRGQPELPPLSPT